MNHAHLALAAVAGLALAGRSRRGGRNEETERLARARAWMQAHLAIEDLTERQKFVLFREYRLVDSEDKPVKFVDIYATSPVYWENISIEPSGGGITPRSAGRPRVVFRSGRPDRSEASEWPFHQGPYWFSYWDSGLGKTAYRWVPDGVDFDMEPT